MSTVEIQRLEQLSEENIKPKRLGLDLSLNKAMLQYALRKDGEVWRVLRDRGCGVGRLPSKRVLSLCSHGVLSVGAALPVPA